AVGYVIFTKFLKHNPKNPFWPDRDRFVLSAGHASMLLYALLHLTGYDLSMDDLKNFRQWGSKTPGHPEYGHTPGVETTTGPLGQGIANAVGMAMAERYLASRYNRPGYPVVDHHTWVVCGDGDLMEGISQEAVSLAGHLGLSKLIVVYDDNGISIEGKTSITFTEDVAKRFEAMNWQVLRVEDGNDVGALTEALDQAKEDKDRPSLVMARTQIAFGSPGKQGSESAHGAPLGEEECRKTKQNLGCLTGTPFHVPEEVSEHFAGLMADAPKKEQAWKELCQAFEKEHPDVAAELWQTLSGELPEGWDADIPDFAGEGPVATRAASGRVLNAIAPKVPSLIGGSADLAPSNKTLIEGEKDFSWLNYLGRNIRFGVREHGMGAILSGMALHKGIRPYGGTFLVFADYMRPAIRVAALMNVPVIYIFTHDSIAVGEDGPTHQPIEHLASLRAIPNLTLIRPADATETAEAWKAAMTADGPVALALSRQKLPVLDRAALSPAAGLHKGAYVLSPSKGEPDVVLVGTGAEVHLALEAQKTLAEKGVDARVVSMPSWELFDAQDAAYRTSVLGPAGTRRVVVEAGIPMGWEKYAGENSTILGIDHFGASAPGGEVLKRFGFTAENVVKAALEL
ncbi:MAG: transketolase, partial [Deltaproteobacteria bacterium]|nr:transketolase [Deltaproteobacteria bacterium]